MDKNSVINDMILAEKRFKEHYLLTIEDKIRDSIADIFFHNHKFTSVYSSVEGEENAKRITEPFLASDYKTVSDFLNDKVIRFANDNTNVYKLLKENVLNNYAIESDKILKSINEEYVTDCRVIIRGSARFFGYDNIVLNAFQKTINKLRVEDFSHFLKSKDSIADLWKKNRFLHF